VPDHVSLWGSLILFRREFDQYLRPVRLMPGVPSPLANRKPGDIDFWVVRENTEGEYSAIGGRMFGGTEREVVVQETVLSRIGVDRGYCRPRHRQSDRPDLVRRDDARSPG
jgi:tartrate dehydrogenase/decarboxylase / D-malate dehydrogenase